MDKNNTILFLECYEKHPCLWNPREPQYRRNDVRLAALKSIIEEMNFTIPVEELKLKIKNLRTTYNRETTKIINSKKSGAGTDDIYKPQLIWFPTADRFLKPVIEERSSKTNLVKVSDKLAVSTNSDTSSYFDELREERDDAEPTEKRTKLLSPKKRAELSTKKEPPILQAVARLESLAENIHQDKFHTFGQHVANQLRSLPLVDAITCQNFINNYLLQERLRILHSQDLATSTPASSAFRHYPTSGSTSYAYTRNASTPESSTSRHTFHSQEDEDYFSGYLQGNTQQPYEGNVDILSEAVRCLDQQYTNI